MKTGKSLVDLLKTIEAQQQAKQDHLVPTSLLELNAEGNLVYGDHVKTPTALAHRQIAEHVGIPQKYYDKCRAEAPALLASNVNEWFAKYPATRLVRNVGPNCRALLSDRYRQLENIDLAAALVPVLIDLKVQVISCELTETKLYIKCVDENIQRDIPKGGGVIGDGGHTIFDTCVAGLTISNSEVGLGRLVVQTSIITKQCTNIATFGQTGLKKHHVGAKSEFVDDGNFDLLSNKTRELTDAALWAQAADVVRGSFDRARFDATIDKVTATTTQKIEDVIKTVNLASTRFGINEEEKARVLHHLIEGADASRYGLFNAITRTAEDLPSYDRASEFERFGGQIVELAQNEWNELALAA